MEQLRQFAPLILMGVIIFFVIKYNKNKNSSTDTAPSNKHYLQSQIKSSTDTAPSNKHYLQSQIKSSGSAYLFWFFFGCHYAYLGKWGLQFLYWITFGGFFIWAIIDLFTLSGRVANHNALIFQQIDGIEKSEREAEHTRNLEMILASKGN
jgi:hypothetical protein